MICHFGLLQNALDIRKRQPANFRGKRLVLTSRTASASVTLGDLIPSVLTLCLVSICIALGFRLE